MHLGFSIFNQLYRLIKNQLNPPKRDTLKIVYGTKIIFVTKCNHRHFCKNKQYMSEEKSAFYCKVDFCVILFYTLSK